MKVMWHSQNNIDILLFAALTVSKTMEAVLLLFVLFFSALYKGMEVRVSQMIGKHSNAELHFQADEVFFD